MRPLNSHHHSLSAWYQEPLGCELAFQEIELLQQILPNLAGDYLLQIGNSDLLNTIETKRIRQRLTVTESFSPNTIQSIYTALPFFDDSVDVIVLPHLLETIPNPQTVLSEAWRVLERDGHLIILGFNPWSLWGLRRLFSKHNSFPWQYSFHSSEKWRKQIIQMKGTVKQINHIFFRPPINRSLFLNQTRWLDKALQLIFPSAGGAYILWAQKRTTPLTPLKSKFNWSELLIGQRVLEPTARGARRG